MVGTLLTLLVLPSATAQESGLVALTPEITDAPLLNPGMGLYVMVGNQEQPDPDAWFMQLCGTAYTRCHWSDLEPERGVYRFDEYFGPRRPLPAGRFGEPEDTGALVALLCSERAAWITGTCIDVDGGWVKSIM